MDKLGWSIVTRCELFQRCVKLVEIDRHLFGGEFNLSGSTCCELNHYLEDFKDINTSHEQLLDVMNNCPQAVVLHLEHVTRRDESSDFVVRGFFIPFHEGSVVFAEELMGVCVLLFKVVRLRRIAVSVVDNVLLCGCGGVHWT